MRAPEPLPGLRVVAAAEVLDALAHAPGSAVMLRFAQDELFVLGEAMVDFPEPGVAEAEAGFVGWWLTVEELARVSHHVEWSIPQSRPVLLQGLVAGVPARLWLGEDRWLLLCPAAYAHELVERLP